MVRWLTAIAAGGWLAAAPAALAAEPGDGGNSVTVGLGGTLIPVPHVTWEPVVDPRTSLVIEGGGGLLPSGPATGSFRAGVGVRRYLVQRPGGGLHVGAQADASLAVFDYEAYPLSGLNATVGGKAIGPDGWTFDARIGAGFYPHSGIEGWPVLPVAMVGLGHTRQRP